MKIRFIRGTTLAGGVPVNPGEVHEVNAEAAHRFVRIWRDAEFVVEESKKAEAKAEPVTEPKPKASSDAPAKESPKKATKDL